MFKALSRGLAALESGPAQLRRLINETGLIVKHADEERLFINSHLQVLVADIKHSGIGGFEAAYNSEFATKQTTPWGFRTYCMMEGVLDVIVPSDHRDPHFCEAQLKQVQAEWDDSGRPPFLSAAFAQLAANTAHAWRGSGWAKDVTPEGWEKFHMFTELARDVMKQSDPGRGKCPYWHRINHGTALTQDISSRERKHRYVAAFEHDVCDPEPHRSMAYQLLPRWHGSYEAFEAQARRAADLTSHERGMEMYARCYDYISGMEDLNNTLVDIPDMMAGYIEWAERWPTQSNFNKLARFAYDVDDIRVLKWVIERHMREIHLVAWEDEAMVAAAFRKSGGKPLARPRSH
jgi:hypothetical protein